MDDAQKKRVVIMVMEDIRERVRVKYAQAKLDLVQAKAKKVEMESDPDLYSGDIGGTWAGRIERLTEEEQKLSKKFEDWSEVCDYVMTRVVGEMPAGFANDIWAQWN